MRFCGRTHIKFFPLRRERSLVNPCGAGSARRAISEKERKKHPMNEKKCKVLAAQIRLETLKVIHSRGFGHVGGSMDLADLMAVLYGEVMKFDPKNPRWEDRDWLVLSKGHAGPVAYATFGIMGYYPLEEAYTLNHPHTKFPSHTDRKLTPGVDLTTGSLGQGVSTATGAALGNKIDGRDNHVFCVIGDGEADEGQVWEGLHFAYAHKLDNIIYQIEKQLKELGDKLPADVKGKLDAEIADAKKVLEASTSGKDDYKAATKKLTDLFQSFASQIAAAQQGSAYVMGSVHTHKRSRSTNRTSQFA